VVLLSGKKMKRVQIKLVKFCFPARCPRYGHFAGMEGLSAISIIPTL